MKKDDGPVKNQMVMAPADIHGAEGTPPRGLHGRGRQEPGGVPQGLPRRRGRKVQLNVALARSSLSSQPGDAELDAKRLSDWLPVEVVFPNAHPAS